MTKTVRGQSTLEENREQLQEIAAMRFGTLSDDEILRFLAERKRLSALEREYEKAQKEEALRLEQEKKETESLKVAEKEKTAILKKIAELNTAISPEKPDDDLLSLVSQRRELEKELEELGGEPLLQKEGAPSKSVPLLPTEKDTPSEKEQGEPEPGSGVRNVAQKGEAVSGGGEKEGATGTVSQKLKGRVDDNYGSEKIQDDEIEGGSEFQRYFDELKNNVGSLGKFLQEMPLDAKKNKAFMLKVAEIDPAYAMHFADKETLKRDENFNLRIAALGNPRNSGNALAEMLPEARTSKVVLVAVKQDYRNVKFIQPNMAEYDEMLRIAKKAALEKVKSLKEATDSIFLIPKLLQQDKQFMLQVKEITEPKKET